MYKKADLPAVNPFKKPKSKYFDYDTLSSFLKEVLTRRLNAVMYGIPGYIATRTLVKGPAGGAVATFGGLSSALLGDYAGLKKFEKEMYGKHLSGGTQYLKRVGLNMIPSLFFGIPGHVLGDYVISRKFLNKNFRSSRIKKRAG